MTTASGTVGRFTHGLPCLAARVPTSFLAGSLAVSASPVIETITNIATGLKTAARSHRSRGTGQLLQDNAFESLALAQPISLRHPATQALESGASVMPRSLERYESPAGNKDPGVKGKEGPGMGGEIASRASVPPAENKHSSQVWIVAGVDILKLKDASTIASTYGAKIWVLESKLRAPTRL
ncbi:hypothetical protein BJX63DRAFT_382666 [Aspergillus granulosus]|uniref:Uncharacterized protein n=1 Tax=Aspergillus granulosus TaxID=176169 RepID=A0ABR4HUN2_9EURO